MNEQIATIPAVGQAWPEQGGIYIGSRVIDGQPHHVIIPGGVEHDIESVEFKDVETRAAAVGEINGHSDWRAPEQEDLMLAWINAREHFVRHGMGSIYWSRSEHHGCPWAVGFEYGSVYYYYRYSEFRVRPFRSFIASSI